MKASEAREIANKNKEAGYNFQRLKVIEWIKNAIKQGEFEINLGHMTINGIHLLDEDYIFFENLGYKVKKPEQKTWQSYDSKEIYNFEEPGIISWE